MALQLTISEFADGIHAAVARATSSLEDGGIARRAGGADHILKASPQSRHGCLPSHILKASMDFLSSLELAQPLPYSR